MPTDFEVNGQPWPLAIRFELPRRDMQERMIDNLSPELRLKFPPAQARRLGSGLLPNESGIWHSEGI